MIAEINVPFSPDLVVMDGIDAFVDGGPATGKRAKGNSKVERARFIRALQRDVPLFHISP